MPAWRRQWPSAYTSRVFEDLLRGWSGEEVVVRFDEPTGSWFFIGVHSTVLGPAMGGTRLKSYDSAEDGLRDVLRLSQAMTMKQAAAYLPFGGGKAVLAVPAVPAPGSRERRDLLLCYADFIESLHGTYVTAADMNTGEADMDVIWERTQHVLGRSPENGGAGDPAIGTAIGVFHGIRAACEHAFGSGDLQERTVLIQGCGAVGARLAEHLHKDGASLLLADVDSARASEVAERVGGTVVEPEDVLTTECDVFSPCATGAQLTPETVPGLRCAVVAGAANNQLGTVADAGLLSERGIVYAPDYVVNAGGVIWLAGYETLGWEDATMQARLEGIGRTLAQVFQAAEQLGTTTAEAADALATSRVRATPGV